MQPSQDSDNHQKMLCGIDLGNLDFNLVEATLASIETKSLTPIIKEELKLKIQSQRLAAGKSELPTPIFKEPEKCELTPEEEVKRDHRRERNRIAAAKCRNKRKSQSEKMKTELAEEELKNHALKRKVEELENEKKEIIKKLKIYQITKTNSPHEITELSSTLIPTPSPTPAFVNLPITQSSPNLPSTSSGIYDQLNATTIPRRFSDDLPRNLGALHYNPRRFSADSCHHLLSNNSQQIGTNRYESMQAFQIERSIPNLSDSVEKTFSESKTFQCSEKNSSMLEDLEVDILSDEEFFRFENDTIPFEQYQIDNHSYIDIPESDTGCMVTTDGGVRQDNKGDNSKNCEEQLRPEEHYSYLVNLIPVFEDEAMVPECHDADRFAVSPGPTSPTFY